MDLLHRKIKDSGDDVYFLISSNENPYYFLQCHGLIKNTRSYENVIIYDIQILDVLESTDMLCKLLQDNPTFKVFLQTKKQKRYFDKKVISSSINKSNSKVEFLKIFRNKYLFEVPCMFTFDTYEEIKQNLSSLNSELIGILNNKIEFLTRRNYI